MKKENIFLFIGIFIIVLGCTINVYAATYLYESKEIYYSTTSSGLSSDSVQGAIDELYNASTDYSAINYELNEIENNFLDKTYPVGSIYMSTTEDTTAKIEAKFGGTWEKIEGKFLLSSSSSYSAGSTGGSANAVVVSHNHTFTGTAVTSGGPSVNPTYKFTGTKAATETGGTHSHTFYIKNASSEAKGYGINAQPAFCDRIIVNSISTTTSSSSNHQHYYTPSGSIAISGNKAHTHSVTAKGTISTNGESGTGKNMPPYLVVYMYKRTK